MWNSNKVNFMNIILIDVVDLHEMQKNIIRYEEKKFICVELYGTIIKGG